MVTALFNGSLVPLPAGWDCVRAYHTGQHKHRPAIRQIACLVKALAVGLLYAERMVQCAFPTGLFWCNWITALLINYASLMNVFIHSFIHQRQRSLLGPGHFFSFVSPPYDCYLHIGQHKQRIKSTQRSLTLVGFEPSVRAGEDSPFLISHGHCDPSDQYVYEVVLVLKWLSATPWRRVKEWIYRPMYSWLQYWLEVSRQLHALDALTPGRKPLVPAR
jgi:hypothetical protein